MRKFCRKRLEVKQCFALAQSYGKPAVFFMFLSLKTLRYYLDSSPFYGLNNQVSSYVIYAGRELENEENKDFLFCILQIVGFYVFLLSFLYKTKMNISAKGN